MAPGMELSIHEDPTPEELDQLRKEERARQEVRRREIEDQQRMNMLEKKKAAAGEG